MSKFLIAGYNPDGSAEIAKAALSVDAEGRFTTVEEGSLTAVNAGRLVWQTAGIEDEAVSVLQGKKLTPLKEADETLRVLYASEAKDGGASLSVEQMTQVAQKVVFYSSAAHPSSIGGDPQFAVLKGGKVLEVHQPEFQDPPLPRSSQIMFSGIKIQTLPGGLPNYRPYFYYGTGLYIRDSFDHVSVTLDSSFFAKNTLTDCDLFYDGSPFKFEQNNTVTNCSLLLGPHADVASPDVLSLMRNFQWKYIGPARIPSNYPHW